MPLRMEDSPVGRPVETLPVDGPAGVSMLDGHRLQRGCTASAAGWAWEEPGKYHRLGHIDGSGMPAGTDSQGILGRTFARPGKIGKD
jgi:hypothetical protein